MRPCSVKSAAWKAALSSVAGLALSVSPAVAQAPPGSVMNVNWNEPTLLPSLASTIPGTPQTPQAAQTPAPGTEGMNQPEQTASAPQSQGLAGSEESEAVNMLGDLLYGTRSISLPILRTGGATNVLTNVSTSVTNPNIAENNSPLPEDRMYFRFNYFHNAFSVTGLGAVTPGQTADNPLVQQPRLKDYDENLYTFGGETTFFDRRASVELRIPFRTTLASSNIIQPAVPGNTATFTPAGGNTTFVADQFNNQQFALFQTLLTPEASLGHEDTEWDNLSIILKGLLYRDRTLAISAGLGITLPTGQDARVQVVDFFGPLLTLPGGNFASAQIPLVSGERYRQVTVKNDAVGLTPFVAALVQPTPRWFAQGFLAVDVPTNSNKVAYTDQVVFGPQVFNPISATANIADQNLLKADVGTGYWLYRDSGDSGLTGIIPTLELHYTTTLNNAQVASLPSDTLVGAVAANPTAQPGPLVGNTRNRLDILDMTVGTTLTFGNHLTVANGIAIPLRSGDNKVFDWEYLLEVNFYFGARR